MVKKIILECLDNWNIMYKSNLDVLNFNLSKTSSTSPEPSEIKMQCQSSVSLLSNEITSFDCSGWWPQIPGTHTSRHIGKSRNFSRPVPAPTENVLNKFDTFSNTPLCQASSRVCSRSRHDLSNNKTSEYRPTVSLGYSSSRNRIQSVLSTWLLPASDALTSFNELGWYDFFLNLFIQICV